MDRLTLFMVQGGLLLFLGTVILVGHFSQARARRDSGAVHFSLSFLCAGLGLVLQAYRGLIPDVFSILFGNGLFLLFGPLNNRAIARTTGQKRDYMIPLLLLDAATLANYTYFTFQQPNVVLRTLEAILVLSVMHLASIDLLLRNKDMVIRPAVHAMIACFVLQLAPYIFRGAIAWKLHLADSWFSWFGIITIAGLALSYLWIGNLRLHAELERTAMTDPLTGLFNRRALQVLAAREIQRSVRQGLPCSALMMDVDRFKRINDTLGHGAGDVSLCAVAGALQSSLRPSDIATRVGGDEFFVLLPDCDEQAAETVVARLRSEIAELELQTVGGGRFHISVSMGRTTQRKKGMTVEDLLHAADILLYREKQLRATEEIPVETRGSLLSGIRVRSA